jgi:crossover junction endodeoxyribonuclease RuvC
VVKDVPTTKIIGVDPGLADTGIGIIQGSGARVESYAFGAIRTSAGESIEHRLERIYSRLSAVLVEERPDLMVIEDVFSLPENPKSGILLGKVCGVIILSACRRRVPVVEVAVREAKQVLTGNGRASKQQLESAVRHLLGRSEPIRPYHASDAIALALIGLYRSNCR